MAVWEGVRVVLASNRSYLGDVGAGVERRTGLVEANVTVVPDPKHRQINATRLTNGPLVALRLCREITRQTIGNEASGRSTAQAGVELLFHEMGIAGRVIGWKANPLIQIIGAHPG